MKDRIWQIIVSEHKNHHIFLMSDVLVFSFVLILYVNTVSGWRAVPANEARYALRTPFHVKWYLGDDDLPRKHLHSIYKFGYCEPIALNKHFLSRTVNMTFVSFSETEVRYIYLLASRHTQHVKMQCVVMKIYVAYKFLFVRSRFPMYYCQGQLHLLMLKSFHRIAVHEFYVATFFRLPATILFEFYHPTPL